MGTPLVETEQDRSIRVEDLPEVVMFGSRRRQAKERLVPLETGGRLGDANDCPALHRVLLLRPNANYSHRAAVPISLRLELAQLADAEIRIPAGSP